ncbi:MAG: helix-turn-helix domain-containing protein, partial [Rhodospirillales bacterium]|nr:helix-turn-helix domain-containing protein [Rhodospirillales bacterium]
MDEAPRGFVTGSLERKGHTGKRERAQVSVTHKMMNAENGQGFEPGVGALLRASRLRCGEELRDVADILRIRYPYLEAIEEGNYQDLPGIAYAVGFVRAYADHLGLDSEEVVRRFKAETENMERRTELVFPSPVPERGTPGAALIFVGLLVAAVAYGAWYVGTSDESVFDDLVSPLPGRLAALVGGDDGQPADAVQTGEMATAPAMETSPDAGDAVLPTEPPASSATETPAAATAEVTAGAQTGADADPSENMAATPVPAPDTPTAAVSPDQPTTATEAPGTGQQTEEAAADAADAVARATAEAMQETVAPEAVEPADTDQSATESPPEPPSAPEVTAPVVAALTQSPETEAVAETVADQTDSESVTEAVTQVAEAAPETP